MIPNLYLRESRPRRQLYTTMRDHHGTRSVVGLMEDGKQRSPGGVDLPREPSLLGMY